VGGGRLNLLSLFHYSSSLNIEERGAAAGMELGDAIKGGFFFFFFSIIQIVNDECEYSERASSYTTNAF
jgi:hypothetical protein